MQQTPNNRQIRLLKAGLIACVVALVICAWFIWVLLGRMNQAESGLLYAIAELEIAKSKAEKSYSEFQAQSEYQEARIAVLEATLGKSVAVLDIPTQEELDALQPGFYELQTSTQYDPDLDETASYTIRHVVVELQYEDYGTKLQMGLASGEALGMIPVPIAAYFDYDGDGQIDTDMAMDFIRDIPVIGGRLAKAYDPVVSQMVYSIFVSEAVNAEYTSVDDMADDAQSASSYLWKFVQDQYETIEKWVLENLPEQEPNP